MPSPELAQQLVDTDNLAVADPTDVRLWARALTTLARAGRVAPAATLARQAQAVAMARGEESAFLELTSVLAYVYLLQGSLELAEEECRRIRSADDTPGAADTSGESEAAQQARAVLAAVLEERGRREEAGRLLEDGPIPRTVPGLAMLELRGRLRVEAGRSEAGLSDLREAGHRARQWEIDNPAVSNWRAVLAGALHRTGAASEAWELAQEQVSVARAFGAAWSLGGALRMAATVAPPAERLPLLAEAVEVLEPSGATLELAHALVELGAFLCPGRREGGGTRSATPRSRCGVPLQRHAPRQPRRAAAALDRGPAPTGRPHRDRRPHADGAPGGRAGAGRARQRRDRRDSLRQRQDGRGPPLAGVPQAPHHGPVASCRAASLVSRKRKASSSRPARTAAIERDTERLLRPGISGY